YQPPRNFVPRSIPMKFDRHAMRDIDSWVKHNARRMMYVNGENDPWSAEPFRLGRGAKDSAVYTVPGGNHGARVSGLPEAQRAKATADILRWAGVAPAAVENDPAKAKPLAKFDTRLDQRNGEVERDEATLRP
ncbi:aminopeptidase, partial [Streptomyces sp. CAI 127]|nr:aminopeptidase [Streptomyces sp. CAI 127]